MPDCLTLPLFIPATRPDRVAKAVAAGAQALILDLEDAIAPADKPAARAALSEAVAQAPAGLPLIVRINAETSPEHSDDLAAVAALPLRAVMLPKSETPEQLARVRKQGGHPVIALVETARGLAAAPALAEACARLAFGSIDFAADLGMAHERAALDPARFALVMASRLAGIAPPLDGVSVTLKEPDPIESDARHAAALGFGGKLLIHPAQIAPAARGFAPSQERIDWARRILAALGTEGGVTVVDGTMVDAPVIKQAQQILARIGEAAP